MLFKFLSALLSSLKLTRSVRGTFARGPKSQLFGRLEGEFVVILNHMRAEFIDIVVFVHVIDNLVESLWPVIFVKEHSEDKSLLSVLNLGELELHSIYEAEAHLILWTE